MVDVEGFIITLLGKEQERDRTEGLYEKEQEAKWLLR